VRGFLSPEDDGKVISRRMTYRCKRPEQAEKILAMWAEDDTVVLRLTPVKPVKLVKLVKLSNVLWGTEVGKD
jgi:hypothetical protein